MDKKFIKDMFLTLQGEGPNVGKRCIFVRCVGCNSWDGRPETKASSPCPWCDTDFNKDEKSRYVDIQEIAESRFFAAGEIGLVISGGEPLLQFTSEDLEDLCYIFNWVDVETNGSIELNFKRKPKNLTVVCSPKFGKVKVDYDVMKIAYPDKFLYAENCTKTPIYLQPIIDVDTETDKFNIKSAVEQCMKDGRFRLSMQIHKIATIP